MTIILALSLLLAPVQAAPAVPDGSAKKALASGIRSYHRLDLPAALSHFDAAIAAFPGWKTASGFRAACRSTLGDAAGAREDAELAAKLKPVDAQSYAARGKARLTLREYDGALADFRAAGEADANSIEGPLGAGSVLSAQAKTREALKALDDAVRLDPQSAAALLMRASVKDRLRDFSGAADDYRSVLEINPKYVWARLYRAKSLRELKDYRGAEAELSSFLEATPDHEDAAYLRSNVRFLLGDFHGTVADLTTVISLDPRKGLAYVNRGLARARLGDNAGAISDLRKALELDPSRRDKIQTAIDAVGAATPAAGEPSAPPARRSAALEPPPADLDDSSPKPSPSDAPPAKRGTRDIPPERRTGEEGSAFIQ